MHFIYLTNALINLNFELFTKFISIIILDDDDLLNKSAQQVQETEKRKKLINQFNYCERAVLTFNNPPRVNFFK